MEDMKNFMRHHFWEIVFAFVFAILVGIVIENIFKPFRHWWGKRKALKRLYSFTGKLSKLTPDKVWEGIRLSKYNEYYYPRPEEDGLIKDCLKNKKNVLIIGSSLKW